MTNTLTNKTENRRLTVSDRCDRCSAQAFVIVKMIAGELYFCAHHFKQHENALNKMAFEIIDERHFINETE